MKAQVTTLVLVLLVFGCAPNPESFARAEVISAGAEATRIANEKTKSMNDIDVNTRGAISEIEIAAAAKRAEEQGKIDVENQKAFGAAVAQGIRILFYALAFVLACLTLAGSGMGLAYAISFAVNRFKSMEFVRIAVDPKTHQPPPYVFVREHGVLRLIDTRTGERATVSDNSKPNSMLTAGTMQSTAISILASAAERIAAGGGKPDAAHALVGIGQGVPMLALPGDVIDGEHKSGGELVVTHAEEDAEE